MYRNCHKNRCHHRHHRQGHDDMPAYALAGNPNCGKSTIFNALTGAFVPTANYGGVTVDVAVKPFGNAKLVDLPGIYSLSGGGEDERLCRHFLKHQRVDLIINVIEAANLERSLFLTLQLAGMGLPMLVVLSMIDEVEGDINRAELEARLGVPVMLVSAKTGAGIAQLGEAIKKQQQKVLTSELPERADGTSKLAAHLAGGIINSKKKISFKERIDKYLLKPWIGGTLFFVVLLAVFQLTSVAGGYFGEMLTGWLESLGQYTEAAITSAFWQESVHGIFSGLGFIISFLPTLFILYLFLALLEGSGFMARSAYVLEGLTRLMKLPGKALLPVILGFGCTVPAILATRTLESRRSRLLTALALPFISCGAKLPVYMFLAAVFFPKTAGLVVTALYLLGILMGVLSSRLLNMAVKKQEEGWVLEIPPWRLPGLRYLLSAAWQRTSGFALRVGWILIIAGVLLHVLQSPRLADENGTILDKMGGAISPVLSAIDLDNDPRLAAALVSGLAAKEAVAGVLQQATEATGGPESLFNSRLQVFAFLVFIMLYAPCLGALTVLGREYGTRYAVFSFIWQSGLAWVVSALIYRLPQLLG